MNGGIFIARQLYYDIYCDIHRTYYDIFLFYSDIATMKLACRRGNRRPVSRSARHLATILYSDIRVCCYANSVSMGRWPTAIVYAGRPPCVLNRLHFGNS